MTSPVMPYFTVDAPTVPDWNYGLTRAATVIDHAAETPQDRRWENGVQYENTNCGNVSRFSGACVDGFTITLTSDGAGTFDLEIDDVLAWEGGYEFRLTDEAGAVVRDWAVIENDRVSYSGMGIACFRRAGGSDGLIACTPQAVNPDTDPEGTEYVVSAVPGPKARANGNTLTTGSSFALYAAMNCATVGMIDKITALTTAKFLAGEQLALERAFEQGMLLGVPNVGVTTIQTPKGTTAIPPKEGLGELDHVGAQLYRGPVTIHAPRWTNPYWADRIATRVDNPYLRDTVANPWAFGAGYTGRSPAGVVPGDGEAWIYATGQVVIHRSPLFTPQSDPERAVDFTDNGMWVIIERRYVITVDCGLAIGVLVTMDGEG